MDLGRPRARRALKVLIFVRDAAAESRIGHWLEVKSPADGLIVEQVLHGLPSRSERTRVTQRLARRVRGAHGTLLLRNLQRLSRRDLLKLHGWLMRTGSGLDWEVLTLVADDRFAEARMARRRLERLFAPDLIIALD
jgi:hypothetical protein